MCNGQKVMAMQVLFVLDSLEAFHLKALTGCLPTHAQTHMYWPCHVPSLLCVLCNVLDDQDHWGACPGLQDALWECGVMVHDQVNLLLLQHSLAAHTQLACALVDPLLTVQSLCATAACVIDLLVHQ